MSTSHLRWAVVMSRNAGFIDQCVELDFQYPSEGIHRRWDGGFRITSCASTPDQVGPSPVFMLSRFQLQIRYMGDYSAVLCLIFGHCCAWTSSMRPSDGCFMASWQPALEPCETVARNCYQCLFLVRRLWPKALCCADRSDSEHSSASTCGRDARDPTHKCIPINTHKRKVGQESLHWGHHVWAHCKLDGQDIHCASTGGGTVSRRGDSALRKLCVQLAASSRAALQSQDCCACCVVAMCPRYIGMWRCYVVSPASFAQHAAVNSCTRFNVEMAVHCNDGYFGFECYGD